MRTLALLVATAALTAAQADPDALYRERENISRARDAATIWQGRVTANGADFESAWKLARAAYWLGQQDVEAARRDWLERGLAAARAAAMLQPRRPEGHFWMAANMGALAESFGLRRGLQYRGAIKQALETVLAIDPAFMEGSADRALGRWYSQVPRLFGGDTRKSETHLRRSLTYNPTSTISHYFLAETLIELDREAEAVEHLRKVIEAPLHPEFAPEDRVYKKKAEDLLSRLTRRRR